MFSYISGLLTIKTPVQVTLDVQGVGYEIFIPLKTFDRLPGINEKATLHIHFSFSETEGIRLFGFHSVEEKELFRALISISKIGPKTAISILSTLSVRELIEAVQMGDVALISTVPGLGKKSSERLIIELKDKVGSLNQENVADIIGTNSITLEAESALLTLGYNLLTIRKAIKSIMKEDSFDSSEAITKAVIKHLYKRK